MAKISISKPARQQSIPKPSVPSFSASHALGSTGQSPGRGTFRPLAKDPPPAKNSWTGK